MVNSNNYPLNQAYKTTKNKILRFPCIGSGSATRNITNPGYTLEKNCIVYGATDIHAQPGEYIAISGVTPSNINGVHRVLEVIGPTDYRIDFDSTNIAAWSSGGTITPFVVGSNVSVGMTRVSGTVAGTTASIWSNKAKGLTFAGDNYVVITGCDWLDLRGFEGWLFLAADVEHSASPSTNEFLFSFGQDNNTGVDNKSGFMGYRIKTATPINIHLLYRTGSLEDGQNGTKNFNIPHTGSKNYNELYRVVTALQYSADGQADTAYTWCDGDNKGAVALDAIAGNLQRPYVNSAGILIGAEYVTGVVSGYANGATPTPSGTKVRNIDIWLCPKMDITMANTIAKKRSSSSLIPTELYL